MTTGTVTITQLLDKIDQITQSFTFNGYAALVHGVLPAVTLAITAYIALIGWFSLQGWSEMTIGHAAKHTLKIAIVFALATQWDVFSEFIYNVFTNGPNEISAVLMSATGASSDSINISLQQNFDAGLQIAEKLWNLSGISIKLAAILIWTVNVLVSGIALFEISAAKFGLSITLVLAPIFVLFLLWNGTKGVFESWLRFSLGFALTPLFVSSVLLVINQLMQLCVTELQTALQNPPANLSSLTSFVLSGITSIGLLMKSAQIATGIAGGIHLHAFGTAMQILSAADKFSGFAKLREFAGKQMGDLLGKLLGNEGNQQARSLAKFQKLRNG